MYGKGSWDRSERMMGRAREDDGIDQDPGQAGSGPGTEERRLTKQHTFGLSTPVMHSPPLR